MRLEIKIFVFSYLLLILTMFVLPFFSVDNYSILKNTTSHLGAQNTPNSWIMNVTFILLGMSSIFAGWSHYKGFWFQKMLLLIFGFSLVAVAIYNHAPINKEVLYNIKEDKLHSLFASITGFSFTILAISTGLIKDIKSKMILPICVGVIATILSIMMFKIENYMGVWQRLIFIISFGWMLYEFKK